MLVLTTSYGFALEELENGTYTIQNQTHHENPVGVAMSSKYLERTTLIEKTDEGSFVTLEFNNTNYMGEFTVKVSGEEVSHEVVYHNEETNHKKIKFLMNDIDAELKIGMYVGPMDRDVVFGVSFDQATLKSTNEEVETKAGEEQQTVETNGKTAAEEEPVEKDEQSSKANEPKIEEKQLVEKDEQSGETDKPETVEEPSGEADEPEIVEEQADEINEPQVTEEQPIKEAKIETAAEASKEVFQTDENDFEKEDNTSILVVIAIIIIGLILLFKKKNLMR